MACWRLWVLASSPATVPAALPWASALLAGVLALQALRERFEIDAEGMSHRTLFGVTRFARKDFLSLEIVADEAGKPRSFVFRFRTGALCLDSANLKLTGSQLLDYLRQSWGVEAPQGRVETLGPVHPVQQFSYPRLLIHSLFAAAFLLVAFSLPTRFVFGGTVLALLVSLPAWRMMATLETDEKGITLNRWLRPAVRFRWVDIQRVRYWNSFLQGGVTLHCGDKRIRVYRMLLDYPRWNRLLHDQVPASRFSPQLTLPLRVGMNRRQRLAIFLVYFSMLVSGIPWLVVGLVPIFAALVALGTAVVLFLLLGTGRVIEVDENQIRDVQWVLGFQRVVTYNRADFLDARLGRHVFSGGLWIRFRSAASGPSIRKLAITHIDANAPAEQVWACLRKSWNHPAKSLASSD